MQQRNLQYGVISDNDAYCTPFLQAASFDSDVCMQVSRYDLLHQFSTVSSNLLWKRLDYGSLLLLTWCLVRRSSSLHLYRVLYSELLCSILRTSLVDCYTDTRTVYHWQLIIDCVPQLLFGPKLNKGYKIKDQSEVPQSQNISYCCILQAGAAAQQQGKPTYNLSGGNDSTWEWGDHNTYFNRL